MKKFLSLFVLLCIGVLSVNAQNDTIYFMKGGELILKQSIKLEDVDSIIFHKPITAPTSGTFTDSRDGNVYKWVKIGTQVWMAENLRYLPGGRLPSSSYSYGSTEYAQYYVYGFTGGYVADPKTLNNFITYGALYNWEAAKAAVPVGWHLPNDKEWRQLTDFLGGESIAGDKLKEKYTMHPNNTNTGAVVSTGFAALLGGCRAVPSGFYELGTFGCWWSSAEVKADPTSIWFYYMNSSESNMLSSFATKDFGCSVRCIKD